MRFLFLFLVLVLDAGLSLQLHGPRHFACRRYSVCAMGASVRTGDNVQILAGNDKGASGKVISINKKKGTVTVEGINMQSKHMKPMKEGDTGRILKREAPIHISNVRVADPVDDEPIAAE
eukprot:CAMPEP_0119310278 /NCGR_PEP_ID=MMETSP1333-20130426/18533_1 /TAXON_ID=418940 /ORGANISM="Scyphosphaera apsteinii, Strain RCC1455" /LENGTH=119 /DNA_ID=CAMNT_0007314433 /DNA_START=21 /DNA_END=380 /DNA_ORIENTATION=+